MGRLVIFFFLLVFFARGMDEFAVGGITRVVFGALFHFMVQPDFKGDVSRVSLLLE